LFSQLEMQDQLAAFLSLACLVALVETADISLVSDVLSTVFCKDSVVLA